MPTHTSSPWIVIPHTNGRLGQTVCFMGTDELTATDVCEIMPEDDNGSAIRVADANARLIAAAPDLLETLQSILHHAHWGRIKDGNELEDIYQLAAAALAKATV